MQTSSLARTAIRSSLRHSSFFWQNMESAHYPWAHDNVERIKQEIERQQELAQKQQQIDKLTQELDSRKGYEAYLTEKANGGKTV